MEETRVEDVIETIDYKPMDSKQVKETLISLFAMIPEIDIQDFISKYKGYEPSVEQLIKNMLSAGEIMESRPGFITLN